MAAGHKSATRKYEGPAVEVGDWLASVLYRAMVGRRPRRPADVVKAMNALGFDVTHHNLQAWLRGTVPPPGVLRPLASALEVSLEELLGHYEQHWKKAKAALEAGTSPAGRGKRKRAERLAQGLVEAKRPKKPRRGTGTG
jgi:hypothetical protein